jgi:putative redox protein
MSPEALTVAVEQVGASELEGAIRSHRVTVDRPQSKGGTDRGPLGGEFLLLALGGCFLSNVLAAARARGVELSGARVDVRGSIAEAPARFGHIEMRVTVVHDDAALVQKLLAIAEQACIVTNTLKRGVQITVELERRQP